MSVFTRVTESEVSAWLTRFSVGSVRALTPISEGIENTNYFLSTVDGEFVLTLYERVPAEDGTFRTSSAPITIPANGTVDVVVSYVPSLGASTEASLTLGIPPTTAPAAPAVVLSVPVRLVGSP